MAGCGKPSQPPAPPPLDRVYTNRANDRVYLDDLKRNREVQAQKAEALRAVVSQMSNCVARVQAALPAGGALQEALAKDVEWVRLVAAEEQARSEARRTLDDARERIRKRMSDEAQDVKAVTEGRAAPAEALPENQR